MDLLDPILGQGTYNALLGNSNATSNYQGQECANSQNSFYGAWAANSQATWLTANSMPSRITRASTTTAREAKPSAPKHCAEYSLRIRLKSPARYLCEWVWYHRIVGVWRRRLNAK